MIIRRAGSNQTVVYAAEELAKYLGQMSGLTVEIEVAFRGELSGAGDAKTLRVGTIEDLMLASETKSFAESEYDDAIYIDVHRGEGIVSGNNPRSVLLAVYRFLTEAGCIWVRPGKDGAYIPQQDLEAITVSVGEKPAYRHRGICIEGASSNRNVLEMIDWMPKLGFNTYFIQFREAYPYYESWHSHRNNPLKQPEPFTVEQARHYADEAVHEIEKRGMIYHAVGHGWTCEPLGLPVLDCWEAQEYEVDPRFADYLAEVKGVRQIWKGIPANTNLCYSNPQVQDLVVNSMKDYLQEHREIDFLHFWLADESNNHCECPACKAANPSDFYVQMLNLLDERLTATDVTTKVAFLLYADLLWAPLSERIRNPDRFILMFAPITRSYSKAFGLEASGALPPGYKRNRLEFPAADGENLAFLNAWGAQFPGDSFIFEYHYMWDHYLDPGSYRSAEVAWEDIRNLEQLGINGYMSCQPQRAFFPTGLGMYVMGKTLWDNKLNFGVLAEHYLQAAFGPDGLLCRDYLQKLSELFDPPYLRGEKPRIESSQAARFARIPEVIRDFQAIIGKNKAIYQEDGLKLTSWTYLEIHADIGILYAAMLKATAEGNELDAASHMRDLQLFLQQNEDAVQPVLDIFTFIYALDHRLFKRVFS